MEIKDKLESIEQRINSLGSAFNALKIENNRLKVESIVLRSRIDEQEQLINELENKNVHLHIAKSDDIKAEESDNIRKKIDQYIKEIDKCIELLNS